MLAEEGGLRAEAIRKLCKPALRANTLFVPKTKTIYTLNVQYAQASHTTGLRCETHETDAGYRRASLLYHFAEYNERSVVIICIGWPSFCGRT